MQNKKSNAYIILTAIFRREEEVWTAECKELGTATFGDTLEEAKDNLREAVELHLNTLEDVGESKRFLDERGIQVHYDDEPNLMRIPELPFDPYILVSQEIRPLPFELACQ
jgi:predicted RNase H-like HicB family nuclease